MNTPPIRIVYIGGRPMDSLTASKGRFSLISCAGPEAVDASQRPDIFLLDPFSGDIDAFIARDWLTVLKGLEFRFEPAYFIIAHASADDAPALLASGFDEVLDWPVSAPELFLRSRVYLEKSSLQQALFAKTDSLDKSFAYLDRFKRELKRLKDELIEEKSNLNAALKQIQQMTAERRRIKAGAADLKEALAKNMEGFGQILHRLIRHRVEKNRGHGEQVAQVAEFVAGKMGVGEKLLEDIRKAAMLHEIGLLFLSDPAMTHLTPADEPGHDRTDGAGLYDRAVMVQFPAKGADLLRLCPGYEAPAKIIERLNENSDGTGYPDGLKRRHIPVASRILAGADELVGLRDREDVQGIQALLSGLEELAGARLDPLVVGWLEKYVILHMEEEDFKVRGVGIEQLEPGMELGTALFTNTGTKLFTANTVLTREFIDKIIQYHREYPVDETVYIKV